MRRGRPAGISIVLYTGVVIAARWRRGGTEIAYRDGEVFRRSEERFLLDACLFGDSMIDLMMTAEKGDGVGSRPPAVGWRTSTDLGFLCGPVPFSCYFFCPRIPWIRLY